MVQKWAGLYRCALSLVGAGSDMWFSLAIRKQLETVTSLTEISGELNSGGDDQVTHLRGSVGSRPKSWAQTLSVQSVSVA
jgi:hypothetical protein